MGFAECVSKSYGEASTESRRDRTEMRVRSAAEPVAIVLTENRQAINFNSARILDFSIPRD